MPFRVFAAGEVLTAANVNDYLAEQAISTFAGTAARASAITAPTEGQFAYLSDSDSLTFYNGSAWVNAGSAIAGTALSSGTATSGQILTANGTGGVSFGNGGLTLIKTESFSGVSAQSINDVFSASYTNYKILINQTSQTNSTGGNLRLRVSGSDNSTASSYIHDNIQFVNSGAMQVLAGAESYFFYSQIGVTGRRTADIDLFNPFDAVPTFFHTRGRSEGAQNGSRSHVGAGYHNQNVSFTGFTIFPDSGTITGVVSVYGYNK